MGVEYRLMEKEQYIEEIEIEEFVSGL